MKVDGSIKSLIQGVSQQPSRNRLAGQCTLQENMSSNPVDGLSRRPPTQFIANLFTQTGDVQFFDLDFGADDKYIMAAGNGFLRCFALNGTEHTVTDTTSGFPYIDGSSLELQTIKDKTYIANTTKVPAWASGTSPVQNYNSIFFVLGGQYGTKYSVTVNWRETSPTGPARSITVSSTTPDGGSASDSTKIATDYIADQLVTALNATTASSFNTTFTITRNTNGDHVLIAWTSPSRTDQFEVIVSDGAGQTGIFACNNLVTDVSKLPKLAPQSYVIDVRGDPNSISDDYYLKFVIPADAGGTAPALGAGFGKNGVWKETVKPGIPYLLNLTTMPHVLTYDFTAKTFSFGLGTWKGRQVGDELSNEEPSFIGNTINDLGFFQSRLVMLSGPAFIASITNQFDDFFIKSATQNTETDAIDEESSAKGVTKMLKAIPFDRDLVIFSDKGQFIIFGRTSLTPQNSGLVLTTAFEAELRASPVAAGHNVFFAINYGEFTGIREFFTNAAADTNDSQAITRHVLKYIPGKILKLSSTSNFDLLLVQSDNDTKNLFPYEYIWQSTDGLSRKVQSSWSKWLFSTNLKHFFFLQSVIYIVMKVGNNYTLESLDLNVQPDTGITYQTHLDRKRYLSGVHTTIVSLYADMPASIDDVVLVQGAGCPNPGLLAQIASYNSGTHTITLKHDMNGGTVIAGVRYLSRYQPTMPFAKDADGVKIGTGVLTVSKFIAQMQHTGDFFVKVFGKFRDDVVLRYSGFRVGNPNTVVGEAPIANLTQTIPFRDSTDNGEIEFYSNSHLPMRFSAIEWVGQYIKKGKRITGQGAG